MTEVFRTKNYQYCETELYMVIDSVTGKPEQIKGKAMFTKKEIMEHFKITHEHPLLEHHMRERHVLVQLDAIKAYPL